MQAAHETRHTRHVIPLLERARTLLAPSGLLLFCDHYATADNGKNPALMLARDALPAALRTAGFTNITLLHDEDSIALNAAHVVQK